MIHSSWRMWLISQLCVCVCVRACVCVCVRVCPSSINGFDFVRRGGEGKGEVLGIILRLLPSSLLSLSLPSLSFPLQFLSPYFPPSIFLPPYSIPFFILPSLYSFLHTSLTLFLSPYFPHSIFLLPYCPLSISSSLPTSLEASSSTRTSQTLGQTHLVYVHEIL